MTWVAGAEPDLAGYDVIRSVNGAVPGVLNAAPLQRLSFLDRSLPKGVTATYVVRAVDSSGNLSVPSPAVMITK